MNWIKKILGITELIRCQEETNKLLVKISENTKKTSELMERWVKAHHI